MVDSGSWLLLLLATSLVSIQSLDPAQVDWGDCYRFSCFVPGSCVGGVHKQLRLARKHISPTCTAGLIIAIEKRNEWKITTFSADPTTEQIELHWINKLTLDCKTPQPVPAAHDQIIVKNLEQKKTLKGMKCIHKLTSNDPNSLVNDLKAAMFSGVIDDDSSFELNIRRTPNMHTLFIGYIELVREEIHFRTPDKTGLDMSRCDDRACFGEGSCMPGGSKQQLIIVEPKFMLKSLRCNHKVVMRYVPAFDEWQVTISVKSDMEIAEEIKFKWIKYTLFVCPKGPIEKEVIPGILDDWGMFTVIYHIPVYRGDKERTCTFTLMPYMIKLRAMLTMDNKEKTEFSLEYKTTQLNSPLLPQPVVLKGFTKEAIKEMRFYGVPERCYNCHECQTPGGQSCYDDKVTYHPGPCEMYTCKHPDEKILVNNRHQMNSKLICKSPHWYREYFDHDLNIMTWREVGNLTKIECVKDFDCQREFPMKSTCCRQCEDICKKVDLKKQPIKPKCEKGFVPKLLFNDAKKKQELVLDLLQCSTVEDKWEVTYKDNRNQPKMMKFSKRGNVVCIKEGYSLAQPNTAGRQELTRVEEKNAVLFVALYVLAAIIVVVAIIIGISIICTKIRARKVEAVGMSEEKQLDAATPVLTVQKMDLKRQVAMIAT